VKITFVLKTTEMAGGIRVVFELAQRLLARGWDSQVYALDGAPEWIDSTVPVRKFTAFPDLAAALTQIEGEIVATLWRTAPWVARSANPGRGHYFVQDVESHLYTDSATQREVLETYRLPLRRITDSLWVQGELRGQGIESRYVGLGVNHDTFYVSLPMANRERLVVANGPRRASWSHLKGTQLLTDTVSVLLQADAKVQVVTFSPEASGLPVNSDRYLHVPGASDSTIAKLLNRANCFLTTSSHEGLGLPALEAMACGCAVVATAADGNLEYLRNGENGFVVERTPAALAGTVVRLLDSPLLATQLGADGVTTAGRYRWETAVELFEAAVLDREAGGESDNV